MVIGQFTNENYCTERELLQLHDYRVSVGG